MSLTPKQLHQYVCDLAQNPEQWAHLVRHDPEQRTFALLRDDDEVTCWVICWSNAQDTGFHDHDASGAAISVISGNVREDRLRLGGSPSSRVAGPGQTLSVPPSAIHRVQHTGAEPAVTIHAYSPPLVRTGAYEITDDGELLRRVQDGSTELRELATA